MVASGGESVMARPVKYETPEDMQRIIDLYFLACKVNYLNDISLLDDLCDEDLCIVDLIEDSRPTVSGLGLALGMTRQSLINYAEKDGFFDTVKAAKQRIEAALEQNLYGQAVTGTIFNLKNNFGWKDKTEQEFSGRVAVNKVERTIVDPKNTDS